MTDTWIIEQPTALDWEIEQQGITVRFTEDGTLRITEDGLNFRVIEFVRRAQWTQETPSPITWT